MTRMPLNVHVYLLSWQYESLKASKSKEEFMYIRTKSVSDLQRFILKTITSFGYQLFCTFDHFMLKSALEINKLLLYIISFFMNYNECYNA